jgi:hypothetical protein
MSLLESVTSGFGRAFDAFQNAWESERAVTARAVILVIVFLGSILIIELKRRGMLPEGVSAVIPDVNHLAAIGWAVSVLLIFELVALALSFARSVANALGAQLEVYSLILLRDAFKQLSAFEEPIEVAGHWNDVFSMIADSLGALGLFIIANGFSRLQRHRPITRSATSQQRFVNIKKMVCLALLGILAWLLIYDAYSIATTGRPLRLFDIFFTTLVFVDVLVALISLGFSRSHPVVFRNFGFALVAVLLRLALASDAFYRPALGVGAGIVAVGITLAYNEAIRALHQEEGPAAVEES